MSFCRHLEKINNTKHSNYMKTRLHTILFTLQNIDWPLANVFYQVFLLILNVFVHALLPSARKPKRSQWTLATKNVLLGWLTKTSFFLWDSLCVIVVVASFLIIILMVLIFYCDVKNVQVRDKEIEK